MENIGGRRIWKARGTAQWLRSTQTFVFYITSVHSTPFQWFLCKKSSIDWVTHRQKKILLTLSNKWMDSYGATHVYLQVVFCRVCTSVNTGLFAQKSLKGCRMDWCDVEQLLKLFQTENHLYLRKNLEYHLVKLDSNPHCKQCSQ